MQNRSPSSLLFSGQPGLGPKFQFLGQAEIAVMQAGLGPGLENAARADLYRS